MLATIKQGSGGNTVKAAQYLTGYSRRKEASGNYDANFVAYMCSWQSKYKLTPDGEIGTDTWKMIAEKAPTCSTSKNKTSAATCAVQLLIGNLTVDGIYGTKTKKAVAAYQSANGLKADGICGAKTWAALIVGSESSVEPSAVKDKVINTCVHYLQWDSKWKNVKYSTHTSKQTIGNSGCGTTSMAMILATVVDKSITPVETSALAVENGYRTYSSGTAWGFYEFCFKKYSGFSKFITTSSVTTLKAALAQGALAVCSMNNNDSCFWTTSGHFVVAIGYDSKGYIYANDPNKKTCPRKQLSSKFSKCLKQAFIFWPSK